MRNNSHFEITEKKTVQPLKIEKFILPESNSELDIVLQSELDDIKADEKGTEMLQNASNIILNDEITEGVFQLPEISTREIFRIELYRPSTNAVVKGKIIHALSKEEALLTGLNDTTINTFISKYFPTDLSVNSEAKPKGVPSKEHTLKQLIVPSIPEVNVEMNVQIKGHSTQTIVQNEAFDIQLSSFMLPQEMTFYAVIAAVNLVTREKPLVIERQLNFQNGKTTVNMPPQLLKGGMYRLTLTLSVEREPENFSYYGTCLTQVI